MRGRKPKPVALRIAAGEIARSRSRDARIPAGVGAAPRTLDAEGRREWRRVVAATRGADILRRTDRATLEVYCSIYARWVAAEKLIASGGLVCEGSAGQVAPSPAVKIAHRCAELLLRYGERLGLTPVDRARLGPLDHSPSGSALNEFCDSGSHLRLVTDSA